MLRPKQVKNGTTASRTSCIVVAWLMLGWSRQAFPDDQSPHLQLAPIHLSSIVRGSLGYILQNNTYGADSYTQQSYGVGIYYGIRARSYFWQPWFARVTGTIGIGVNATTNSGTSTNKSLNRQITGDTTLNILRDSRFPFQARVYRMENQTNGYYSGINSNYITNGYNLNQNYATRNGKLTSEASYSHQTNGRVDFGTDNVTNQLNLTLTAQPASSQTFRVTGGIDTTEQPQLGSKFTSDTIVTNHLYRPNSVLSVASLLNLIKTSYTTQSGTSSQQQNDANSQQLSSFAAWRPPGSPLTLTSSALLLRSVSSDNGITAPQYEDTNLNLGANYAWSSFLRTYGSIDVDDNSGIQTITTNANLAAQRLFGDRMQPLNLDGYTYTRYMGATLSNATVTTTSNQTSSTSSAQSLGGTLGHRLFKNSPVGGGRLTTDANQALLTTISTQGTPHTTLRSNGTLSWGRSENGGVTSLRLGVGDSREFTSNQPFFQLVNLQASRTEHVGRDQLMNGNLTMQFWRSGADNVQTTPFSGTPSANLNYQNLRVFRVKNLVFNSTLTAVSRDISSSPNYLAPNQATLSWDNNLDYAIGRLRLQFYTRMAEINQIKQSSIFLSLFRTF